MLSYVGGISVISLIFLYLTSYMFRFCKYHRMFLHYIESAIIYWFKDDDQINKYTWFKHMNEY